MSTVYPVTWLRCMKPEDRASLGKAGLLPEEVAAKTDARNERELQRQIVQYLRLHNIEVCWHRTDKKSAATIGWPDLTFSVGHPLGFMPNAWEIKFGDGKPSKEQEQMAIRLQSPPNAWRYRIIRSFEEAVAELKQMGIV